ncbi:threonine--tRNA ligase [Patescibacteria group bacterium]
MKSQKTNRLYQIRHSLAHILAHAVQDLYPDVKFGIGPVIDNGFYYDFDLKEPLTIDDLPRIEKRMRELLKENITFEKVEASTNEAKELEKNQPYKLELVDEFTKAGEKLTFYKSGKFTDLCKYPHVESTEDIPADVFKLDKVAGAYWRGSEQRPMLQRVYGLAFENKAELDNYLKKQEQAEDRDHRKLGRQLDLYSFDPVAPGAVFWHPNGMIIWRELENLLVEYLRSANYQEVQTPLMVKPEVFEQSGHLKHYQDNMFKVHGGKKLRTGYEEEFYLKPMNCPESTYIYSSQSRSYRDLPLRYAEIGRIHRNELSGTLGGLFRVRQITQDDGHLYLRPDQLANELTKLFELSIKIYKIFGLKPRFYLATRPDKALGDKKLWAKAEEALAESLKANNLEYELKPKDGAFYAPKIDIHITDALDRDWQLCTIQADLVMIPSFPGVEYTDDKGKKQKPVVVHRAILGSFERFIGIITEHYAGAFPTWLHPIQVQIIPVGQAHIGPANKLAEEFRQHNIRVAVDDDNETVGNKIRISAQLKVPYALVIGDKETSSDKLAIRVRGQKDIISLSKSEFIKKIKSEIADRQLAP